MYKSSPIRALLTHYKWDFQRLIGEYFESDRDTFFGQAQLPNPFNVLPVSQPTHDSNDCKICFSEETPDVRAWICIHFFLISIVYHILFLLNLQNLYSLECGHKYCKMCWNQYLSVKIADDGVNDTIFCPEQKCGILVDDEDVIQLVTSPEVLLKYQRSMSNSFVQVKEPIDAYFIMIVILEKFIYQLIFYSQHNQAMRWCPSAGCSYAAKKKQISKSPCTCKCGHEFCFDCMEYWHVPISCSRLKQWKNNDDGETFQWIAQNAKLCPGCQAIIEKNGGCNHMVRKPLFYKKPNEWHFKARKFGRLVAIVVMNFAGFAREIGTDIMLAIALTKQNLLVFLKWPDSSISRNVTSTSWNRCDWKVIFTGISRQKLNIWKKCAPWQTTR